MFQLLKRTIRVDHVLNYKVPKEHDDEDEITKKLKNEGCAPIVHGSDNSNVESDKDEKTLKKGWLHLHLDQFLRHMAN